MIKEYKNKKKGSSIGLDKMGSKKGSASESTASPEGGALGNDRSSGGAGEGGNFDTKRSPSAYK